MTTLISTRDVIAADRQTTGDIIEHDTCKIYLCYIKEFDEYAYVAFCGSVYSQKLTLKQFSERDYHERLTMADGSVAGIVLTESGLLLEFNHMLQFYQTEYEFAASGSGLQYAIAAFECTHDVIRSIKVAARHDNNTNSEVDYFLIEDIDVYIDELKSKELMFMNLKHRRNG